MDRLLDRPASPRIHRGFSSKLNRDLVAILGERGLSISHSTILRWVVRYADTCEKRWRRFERPVSGTGGLAGGSALGAHFRRWCRRQLTLTSLNGSKVDELMTLCGQLETILSTGDDIRRLIDALLHEALASSEE